MGLYWLTLCNYLIIHCFFQYLIAYFNDLLFVNFRSDSLQAIATSILYNFSYLQEVYFTIEGQEPRIEGKKHTGHRYLLDWSIVE